MLERIQMISNVGSFCRVAPGGIGFSQINIIYGENRNGKSTLCDIFYSLSLNNPQLILDRKSIIPNREPDQIQQRVEIKFAGQQSVRFLNNIWDSQIPDDSKLHIFDHGFIHRNVMTGTTYSRENSSNVSGFILGENAAQFEALETRNQQLRTDRRTFNACKKKLEMHNVGDVDVFVALPLPDQTLAQFDVDIQTSKIGQQELSTKISNVDQVTRRSNLEITAIHEAIDTKLQSINRCLALNMENVHETSRSIVLAQKEKVNDSSSFDGWAAEGMVHLDDDCPFCGQELGGEAQSLIESYRSAFDNTFQDFVVQVKTDVATLQRLNLISANVETIREQHERNLVYLGFYVENTIAVQLEEHNSLPQLVDSFENIERMLEVLNRVHEDVSQVIRTALNDKQNIPYNAIAPVCFVELQRKLSDFNESVEQYNAVKHTINAMLIQFKESQDITALLEIKDLEVQNEALLITNRTRFFLNNDCVQYSDLKAQIEIDRISYESDKTALEDNQEVFLDTYFNEINTLFRRIGSSDFEISRRINRGGARTIYDLEVTFKGRVIDRAKLDCLFSESDRRALALCIFLAKIHQLPSEERAKAILVMDDPVTSFDNERISSILRILFALRYTIKQMIITTHYKGMASAMMKKFNEAQAIRIFQTADGSEFETATKSEMTATAHDERYMEIMEFVGRGTQDNKLTKLRPFIEDEMRQRYKLPLISLGLSEVDTFNDCIEALKNNQNISTSVAISLHDYRTTLNLPSHELDTWTLDDSRTYAECMMEFIYSDL